MIIPIHNSTLASGRLLREPPGFRSPVPGRTESSERGGWRQPDRPPPGASGGHHHDHTAVGGGRAPPARARSRSAPAEREAGTSAVSAARPDVRTSTAPAFSSPAGPAGADGNRPNEESLPQPHGRGLPAAAPPPSPSARALRGRLAFFSPSTSAFLNPLRSSRFGLPTLSSLRKTRTPELGNFPIMVFRNLFTEEVRQQI